MDVQKMDFVSKWMAERGLQREEWGEEQKGERQDMHLTIRCMQ